MIAAAQYYFQLKRLRLYDERLCIISSVTCTAAEARPIARWLAELGRRSKRMPLPRREYRQRPWKRDYRWTAAAWARYGQAVARVRAKRATSTRTKKGTGT